MRVTIEVDDELFERVARILGGRSKREVVHRALEAVSKQERAVHLARIRGDDLVLNEVPRRRFEGGELLAAEGLGPYEVDGS